MTFKTYPRFDPRWVIFFHNKGGVGKIGEGGGSCFKKGVSLIFILTLSNGYIFLSVWCADDCFVYLYHFYQYSL